MLAKIHDVKHNNEISPSVETINNAKQRQINGGNMDTGKERKGGRAVGTERGERRKSKLMTMR